MGNKYLMQTRVAGILIENEKMLIVNQSVSSERAWSLPGGRVERGEEIGDALIREMEEETGLQTKIVKLLYLCEKPENVPPILHITFLLEKIGGKERLPSNEFDENPIHDVKMAPINELAEYGFPQKFIDLARNQFPDAGSYKGHKKNIGL